MSVVLILQVNNIAELTRSTVRSSPLKSVKHLEEMEKAERICYGTLTYTMAEYSGLFDRMLNSRAAVCPCC
jgi:hypothetical protein